MLKKLLFLTIISCFTNVLWAQIKLDNASFEGEPQDATVPVGWFPCAAGTTPDILPGYWGVYEDAAEGDTYIGLITRADGSFESIGQRLQKPIKRKECYNITMDLAHSDTYSGYNGALKLRIWGGSKKCQKDQLLGETKTTITDTDWSAYNFQFKAKKTINYIIIEAYHEGSNPSHQGNILIDNIAPLSPCIRASLY